MVQVKDKRLTSSSSATEPPMRSFPSYADVPGLPHHIKFLCELIAKTPDSAMDAALSKTNLSVSPADLDAILRLSYGSPASAVKFFRWVLRQADTQQLPSISWTLMVDVLGKNRLFDEMWDAVKSMKPGGLVTLATFASAFSSYVQAGRTNEAFMSFEVMDRYGVPKDVVALNSLLSAVCSDGSTSEASRIYEKTKTNVTADGDTFAILLEGWEKEGDAVQATRAFGEMIVRLGWIPDNRSAYDAFLTTLVKAGDVAGAVKFLNALTSRNCSPTMKFFANSICFLVEKNDVKGAADIWAKMVLDCGLVPNFKMYNLMIGLLCRANDDMIDNIYRLLDEMPYNGAFPDSTTYNMIFECLIRRGKMVEARQFFIEMKKNECHLDDSIAALALKAFFVTDDPETATEFWTYMVENETNPREESANSLLVGLGEIERFFEVRRFADYMIDTGIYLHSSTMAKLKKLFAKAGKPESYERIARRWKARVDDIGQI